MYNLLVLVLLILRLKHFNSSPYLFRCLSLLPKYYFPMTSLLLLKYDVFVLSTRLILFQWGWKRSSSLWQTFLFCKFSFTLSPSCCLTCRGSEEAVLRRHAGVLSRCAGLHRTGKDASAALHNCYITTRSAAVLRVFCPAALLLRPVQAAVSVHGLPDRQRPHTLPGQCVCSESLNLCRCLYNTNSSLRCLLSPAGRLCHNPVPTTWRC